MTSLFIQSTKNSFNIDFSLQTGIFNISDDSYPENPFEFFNPIILWVEKFIENYSIPIQINVNIGYMNSSSTKCIMDLLELFDKYFDNGNEVELFWYYNIEDPDMKEMAEELTEDLKYKVELCEIRKKNV